MNKLLLANLKYPANIARLILGLLFVFSGFVKGIDLLGSTYKFDDYFKAFSMEWLSGMSFPLAAIQNALEMLIGAGLIFNLRPRFNACLALIFMVFFTALTFVLALTNPVSDCGCFGDALTLTNWQTFFKNLILLVLALLVFVYRNNFKPLHFPRTQTFFLVLLLGIITWLMYHNYKHLPWIDFRPYYVGANIDEGMRIPEGAPHDVYKSTVVLEKDGKRYEFPSDNYPWEDSTYVWVETNTELVAKGYEPPIHDFVLSKPDGMDLTDEILRQEYAFLVVAHRIENTDKEELAALKPLADYCQSKEYPFYVLTSSSEETVKSVTDLDFLLADDIMLKTVVRANPALVILHHGTIIGKWAAADAPSVEQFKDTNPLSLAMTLKAQQANNGYLWLVILMTIFIRAYFRFGRK